MIRCPVCFNMVSPKIIEAYKDFNLHLCSMCHVIFAIPFQNPGPDWYRQSPMYSVGKVLSSELAWHHKQFLGQKKMLGKKMLDIGCGTGVFMKEARSIGYEVWGIDFDKDNIQIARERYQLNRVYDIGVESLAERFSDDRFDVITFFEVLEHLDDPVKFIGSVRRLLSDDGHIALSVPNRERLLDTLGEGDYPPNHLSRWSKVCLTRFLESNGFEVIRAVVKRLDAGEVAAYLQTKIHFNIANKLATQGVRENNQTQVQKAVFLTKFKSRLFSLVVAPLAPVLKVVAFQGTGLFILAKRK